MRHPLRWAVALVLFAAPLGGASLAQAATGGASAIVPVGGSAVGPEGQDIAFTPFRSAGASWYGPGLFGRRTACGETLRRYTLGVANRNLPCGTVVKFVYEGRSLITQVIDRGPFVKGRAWDLTAAASEALEFEGVGRLRYAVAIDLARHPLRR